MLQLLSTACVRIQDLPAGSELHKLAYEQSSIASGASGDGISGAHKR